MTMFDLTMTCFISGETVFIDFYQAAIAIKICNLLICFCSFELSCPILEIDSFTEMLHIVLSCLIK